MHSNERLAKLRGSRKEAELGYSLRERAMIQKLEAIATGRTNLGASTDLEVARDIAFEALEEAGWPTVRDCKNAP